MSIPQWIFTHDLENRTCQEGYAEKLHSKKYWHTQRCVTQARLSFRELSNHSKKSSDFMQLQGKNTHQVPTNINHCIQHWHNPLKISKMMANTREIQTFSPRTRKIHIPSPSPFANPPWLVSGGCWWWKMVWTERGGGADGGGIVAKELVIHPPK